MDYVVKKYNEIKAKDNMKIEKDDNGEEVKVTEKKELKSVVSKAPKKKKRSLVGRLVTGVLGPDGIPGVGAHINEEIIVPAIKSIIMDAVNTGAHMILYRNGGGPRGGGVHRTNYNAYSSAKQPYRPSTNYTSRYTRNQPEPTERRVAYSPRQGVDEYIIEDRLDAAQVLTALTEHADMYDVVSVADYYDLIDVEGEYTDHNHGWTFDTITQAAIVPVRGGYMIKFPPTDSI